MDNSQLFKNGQDRGNLGDTEMITIDERNRFFIYSWGDFNTNLEGKYFHTDDNKILLVTDQHDSTYEHDQNLQFFIIDPEKGTITEEEAYNMLPKEFIDRNSIFQVRYATEGVVAVFDDGEGGLDAKTLRAYLTRNVNAGVVAVPQIWSCGRGSVASYVTEPKGQR